MRGRQDEGKGVDLLGIISSQSAPRSAGYYSAFGHYSAFTDLEQQKVVRVRVLFGIMYVRYIQLHIQPRPYITKTTERPPRPIRDRQTTPHSHSFSFLTLHSGFSWTDSIKASIHPSILASIHRRLIISNDPHSLEAFFPKVMLDDRPCCVLLRSIRSLLLVLHSVSTIYLKCVMVCGCYHVRYKI